MRRIITALVLLAALALTASAQWQFAKSFLPAGLKLSGNGIHGIAVDAAGKVWITPYDVSDSVIVAGTTNKYAKVRCIYVYQPNGTAVDTIKTIVVNSVRDTLYNSSRGLSSDPSAQNIYHASFDVIYKINSSTRAGALKVTPLAGQTMTACAVDSLGEIFTGFVIPGTGGIKIFGPTGTFIGNVTDTTRFYSRTLAVSNDGNDVYFAGYTGGCIIRYRSANGSIGPYSTIDTLLKGMNCESMDWNTKNKTLWVSAGYSTLPPGPQYFPATWYAYNPTTNAIVDGFHWNPITGHNVDPRPRAIAFSPTGDTCYVGMFNQDTADVQMWTRVITNVEKLPGELVPSGYALEQNYPNPFNPSTTIQFTLAKAGFAQLFVYDMLGRDIATLVNKDMSAGTYRVTFDASRLTSGTYIYELRSGDARIIKKMLFLK